ncbi:MAG: MAE_28990/MAE_18760 family HEPN-like nuclease [Pseudomonadota bacterium]
MSELSAFFDTIDRSRLQRTLELADLKFRSTTDPRPDRFSIQSKAVVVLSYAHWEGFYNECVDSYVQYLSMRSEKVASVSWNLLVGALSGNFVRLRDRNHTMEARSEFVAALREKLECKFDQFDLNIIKSRSNLNFERLSSNFRTLEFDISPFAPSRLRIDKELVGWRHAVAHGSPPDLSSVDIGNHVEFTLNLMEMIATAFQEAAARLLAPAH